MPSLSRNSLADALRAAAKVERDPAVRRWIKFLLAGDKPVRRKRTAAK